MIYSSHSNCSRLFSCSNSSSSRFHQASLSSEFVSRLVDVAVTVIIGGGSDIYDLSNLQLLCLSFLSQALTELSLKVKEVVSASLVLQVRY